MHLDQDHPELSPVSRRLQTRFLFFKCFFVDIKKLFLSTFLKFTDSKQMNKNIDESNNIEIS